MSQDVKEIIRQAVGTIIDEAITDQKLSELARIHHDKIHFVPAKYRVIGGVLQSLNIKFGNFIEQIIQLVVERDPKVMSHKSSGQRLKLYISPETDQLIDRYITARRALTAPVDCSAEFHNLCAKIFEVESNTPRSGKQRVTYDVDALFKASDGQIVYLEIKYNDDHDTGKFVDINRKFLKTYAGLISYLGISSLDLLKPILYYFNPSHRYGPVYVPLSNNYRGAKLFDEYFELSFVELDGYLREIGDDPLIIAIFDKLYNRIRYNTSDTE